MEELYLDKLISYPRTDSDVYPKDFDHNSNLEQFTNHTVYGVPSSKILKGGTATPTRGRKDAGDHIPITPIASVEISNSRLNTPVKLKVYDLLTRHYLALFYPPAKEMKAELGFNINMEPFRAHNLDCISPGYLELLPEFAPKYAKLPTVTQGRTYPVMEVKKEEKLTTAPPRYNDTTLVQLMEKKKIGTKSTRPTMIQILLDRQYAQRVKKQIQITPYGHGLMANLETIWSSFLEPDFTRHVEELLESILEGKESQQVVVDGIRGEFLTLFDAFRSKKATITRSMQAISLQGKRNGKGQVITQKREQLSTSDCPFCGKARMKVVKTHKGTHFLACTSETCKKNLALPKKGRISFLKTKCLICGFSPIRISTSKNKHPFTYNLCPNCWTRSFQESENKQGFCKNCAIGKIEYDTCQAKASKVDELH
ncbi:MAG: DNA topoisomerase I [Promethearchaeota archaeon CR_4]|nr:MAG: DNA topoisomerase I [Candidatus Lokiarchaeota archaeon CR_4]